MRVGSDQAYAYINEVITPTVITKFKLKQRDYSGGPAFLFLGSKGQFSDMNRKFWKLYAAVWEGKELEGEQPIEIAEDMIGHLLLLIYTLLPDEVLDDQAPPEEVIDNVDYGRRDLDFKGAYERLCRIQTTSTADQRAFLQRAIDYLNEAWAREGEDE